MGKRREKEIKKIILLLIIIFMGGCANQLPPPGGPVDRTPPEIISIFPESGTINFKKNFIEVKFSEYVDKRTFQDALFISPALEETPEFDWSGKSVRVKFANPLDENLTYVITIGTDVKDLNNQNRLSDAFSIAFSTGDKIDNGSIEGKIFTDEPQGMMIFAYNKKDTLINPAQRKPKYISQTGTTGNFSLKGLASGEYRIFAVKDEFGDLLYSIGEDKIGIPFQDVVLSDEDTLFQNLNFFITVEDTTPPRFVSANMTDKNHILIEFSEKPDSTILRLNNFRLIDSTLNKTIPLKYIFKGRSKDNESVITINENLSEANQYYLFAETLRDENGNEFKNDFSILNVTERPDTSDPKIANIKTNSSGNRVNIEDPLIIFNFDDGIDQTNLQNSILIKDEAENIFNFILRKIDDASFQINILGKLQQRKEYTLNLNLANLKDAAGNSADSIYAYKFMALQSTDFSGASGIINVLPELQKDKVRVVLQQPKSENVYQTKITQNGNFNFDKVEPGRYLLWIYEDKNSDEKYTFGNPFPFEPSEKFKFYPDTLSLRARWPVGDISIQFE